MKHISPNAYSGVLLHITHNAPASSLPRIVHGFLTLLKKNKDWRKRHEIVRALEALVRSSERRHLLIIQSARPLTQKQRARITTQFPAAKYDYEEHIVPELVAGVRLTIDERISADGSLSHMLTRLFAPLDLANSSFQAREKRDASAKLGKPILQGEDLTGFA